MNASIEGALGQLNKSYRDFQHKGKYMTKDQVKSVLEYGLSKGYTEISQLTDKEVDDVLKEGKELGF